LNTIIKQLCIALWLRNKPPLLSVYVSAICTLFVPTNALSSGAVDLYKYHTTAIRYYFGDSITTTGVPTLSQSGRGDGSIAITSTLDTSWHRVEHTRHYDINAFLCSAPIGNRFYVEADSSDRGVSMYFESNYEIRLLKGRTGQPRVTSKGSVNWSGSSATSPLSYTTTPSGIVAFNGDGATASVSTCMNDNYFESGDTVYMRFTGGYVRVSGWLPGGDYPRGHTTFTDFKLKYSSVSGDHVIVMHGLFSDFIGRPVVLSLSELPLAVKVDIGAVTSLALPLVFAGGEMRPLGNSGGFAHHLTLTVSGRDVKDVVGNSFSAGDVRITLTDPNRLLADPLDVTGAQHSRVNLSKAEGAAVTENLTVTVDARGSKVAGAYAPVLLNFTLRAI